MPDFLPGEKGFVLVNRLVGSLSNSERESIAAVHDRPASRNTFSALSITGLSIISPSSATAP